MNECFWMGLLIGIFAGAIWMGIIFTVFNDDVQW